MSASFWSQVRWRLGGHMSSANRINDLIQKQIDANSDVQDVTTEEILAPIVTLPSKMTMTDRLFKAKVRDFTVGTDCLFPMDPDLVNLRLWLKNFHGGTYLEDWSFMGNTVQLNGTTQSELIHSTDDDGTTGGLPVNYLIDDQYVRTLDNPNVRIKEISATATGISIFVRVFVTLNANEANTGLPGVLFSKIDTEQVDYAYAAYVRDDGSIVFMVRNGGREYVLTAPADTVTMGGLMAPDFLAGDFEGTDFQVTSTSIPLPEPIPYDDLCFTFQFSNARMQIMKNGSIVKDTNSDPEATNLVGWWRLNEGGDIGNTADAPSSYSRTVFNSVATGNNGLVANATWTSLPPGAGPAGNLYLLFDDVGSDSVTIGNYTGIDALSTFTVSLWYFVRTNPTTGEEDNLIKKNWNNNSSFSVLANNPSGTVQLVFSIKDSVGTVRTTTKTTPFPTLNVWYHIVVRWGGTGTQPSLTVNGVKTIGASLTGTVSTGATNLIIGDTSTSTPDGFIHDVKFWSRTLSDTETTTLFNAGHAASGFPSWQANPPTGPPPPSPTTNPFVSVYNVALPIAAEQDVTRLHKITASSLTERYNVGQGTQADPVPVSESPVYDNNPTYDSGTAVQEVLSTGYNALGRSITGYAFPHRIDFMGERVETGLDVIGKKITKVVVKLADINPTAAPATGSVVAKIISGTSTLRATSQNVDASTLINNGPTPNGTDWTSQTFTFTGNSYVMANDDRIQFEYDQGGTGGETISDYQQLSGSISNAGIIGPNAFTGEMVMNTSSSLHNQVISKIVVKLARYSGTPSGNMQAFIIRDSTGATLASSNLVAASTVTGTYPGSYTSITFTFSGNTTAMNGSTHDYIRIMYNFSGGSSELVMGLTGNTEPNVQGFVYNTSFGFDFGGGAVDAAMDIYTGAGATKQLGCALTNTGVANAVKFGALWSDPTNIIENAASDVCMDIYFDTATGSPNHQYTQLRLDSNKFVAEYVNSTSAGIYGQRLTKITARVYKVGSPTGTLFCRIKKGSDNSTITFGLNGIPDTGLTVSSLTTTNNPATLYSFENDANGDSETGYALTTGDRVMFELSGGSSTSSNYVQVARTTTASTVPNVHLQTSTAGTSWTTSSNDDVIGTMHIGGFTIPAVNPYYTLGYTYDRILQKVTSTTAAAGNIYNQKITQVKVWLKRLGSPTGTLTVGVRNAAGTLVANINTFDVTGISDIDFTQYTFTNLGQAYTMALNDRISIEYSGGNSSNHVQVNANLLNTYPYGNLELFSGSTYTTKASYDLAGVMSSGGGATDPLARTRVSELCATANSAIKLKKISRVKVRMKRTGGTLPGNVIFRVRSAANTIMQEIGTVSAISVDPNTLTEYTITSSPIAVYALQVGDRVSIEYNDGDDFNYIDVMTTKTTDAFDGTVNTYLEKYDDINWVSNNAIDLVGEMWEGGDTFTPSQEDVLIPDPLYTKDLTVMAGGHPWTYVDHSLPSLTSPESQSFINGLLTDFRFYRKILTTTELTNLFTNRIDIGAIAYSKVALTGYFAVSEE